MRFHGHYGPQQGGSTGKRLIFGGDLDILLPDRAPSRHFRHNFGRIGPVLQSRGGVCFGTPSPDRKARTAKAGLQGLDVSTARSAGLARGSARRGQQARPRRALARRSAQRERIRPRIRAGPWPGARPNGSGSGPGSATGGSLPRTICGANCNHQSEASGGRAPAPSGQMPRPVPCNTPCSSA